MPRVSRVLFLLRGSDISLSATFKLARVRFSQYVPHYSSLFWETFAYVFASVSFPHTAFRVRDAPCPDFPPYYHYSSGLVGPAASFGKADGLDRLCTGYLPVKSGVHVIHMLRALSLPGRN